MSCLWPLCHSELLCTQQSKSLIKTLPSRFFGVWSTYRCVTCLALYKLWTKFYNVMHLILIVFSSMSVLPPACIYKHEIILFHNTLTTILLIMCIYFPCLCLISLFLSNLSKSHLFTSHICFQFRVHEHHAFKLMPDMYDLWFECSSYAWKNKETNFPM
jgi:hypothetical protein